MAVEGAMKMDDWHFKIVIADIELHKVRTGAYPETLSDLKFISKEDLRAISGVSYTRLDTGYELNFARNRTAEQLPHYPKEFWQGLGLVRSNLKHD
jgi:hypothetical protein